MVAIFLGSSLTGLNHGVKWLSNLNILLGAILLIFIFDFWRFKIYFRIIHTSNF